MEGAQYDGRVSCVHEWSSSGSHVDRLSVVLGCSRLKGSSFLRAASSCPSGAPAPSVLVRMKVAPSTPSLMRYWCTWPLNVVFVALLE